MGGVGHGRGSSAPVRRVAVHGSCIRLDPRPSESPCPIPCLFPARTRTVHPSESPISYYFPARTVQGTGARRPASRLAPGGPRAALLQASLRALACPTDLAWPGPIGHVRWGRPPRERESGCPTRARSVGRSVHAKSGCPTCGACGARGELLCGPEGRRGGRARGAFSRGCKGGQPVEPGILHAQVLSRA